MSGRLEPFKQAQDYLPRLKAVFFARWDEDKGCEITYQVPENSIRVTSTTPYHPNPHPQAYSQVDQDDQNENHSIPPLDQSDTYSNQDQLHQIHPEYLFEFTNVLDFILPKKHLCGHLVTISSGSAKILGFPNLIVDEEKYERNFFMFNLCFVFDKDSELSGYEPIARKTGRVLKSLEQKNSLLSTPNNSTFEIKLILEELYEELNSFSEVSIAINPHPATSARHQRGNLESPLDNDQDERRSVSSALFLLNLKLFPFYGNPPEVEDWNVPISLVSFLKLRSEVCWDLTMYKLVPFIDGTATVHKISRLADVDISLARECIQHLVFFGCCILTDPFRFSNCYALAGGRTLDLLGDSNDFDSIKLREELLDYILIKPTSSNPPLASSPNRQVEHQSVGDQEQTASKHFINPSHHLDHNQDVDELFLYNNDEATQDYYSSHSIPNLLNLYQEFRSGITVHDWMEQNQVHKLNIDVRRFISFGTIKGFLKRLHCYPIWTLHPDLCDQSGTRRGGKDDMGQESFNNNNEINSQQTSDQGVNTMRKLPQQAWLTVLKRLNHFHPLLSPNLPCSDKRHPSSSHQEQKNPLKKSDRNLDQTKPTTTSVTSPARMSSQNQKKYISSLRKPSTLLSHSNDQIKSTSSLVHQRHPSSSQYHHLHHQSVAVQVPQDLPLKLNGSHHVDQLCVEFRISFIQLEQILRYIDTLSLLEISYCSTSSFNPTGSTMHTVYY